MKRLVILGEGHGETSALPVLARKILKEKDAGQRLFVDDDIIRTHNPLGLVKWNRQQDQSDNEEWLWHIRIAARRGNVGGILAVLTVMLINFQRVQILPFALRLRLNQWQQLFTNSAPAEIFPFARLYVFPI